MGSRWLGLDPARVEHLAHRTAVAAAELEQLVGSWPAATEPAAAETAAVARTIAAGLRAEWLPTMLRVAADPSLTDWSATTDRNTFAIPVPQPPDGGASAVARWWDRLTGSQQQAVVSITPSAVGNLDGVAAWARDAANRQTLSDDLRRLEAAASSATLDDRRAAMLANARSVQEVLAAGAGFDDPRTGRSAGLQLYVYEPGAFDGDGRAAVVVGDLDFADHIAVAVPGMGTEASRIGLAVPHALFAAASGHTDAQIAVLTWVGYDAPSIDVADGDDGDPIDDIGDWVVEAGDLATVATAGRARGGAAWLAADISGIRARRGSRAHVTVLGNSYGSTTVAIAADEFGLAADDVVLTGSPGAGGALRAEDLTTGASHTWVGSASDDPVSHFGRTGGVELHDAVEFAAGEIGIDIDVGLGQDPTEDDFGARRFQAESARRDTDRPWSVAAHDRYFDRCGESLRNIGAIIAADYDAVTVAEHRHKDESWDVWDPFADLVPVDPEADRPVADVGSCDPLGGLVGAGELAGDGEEPRGL